MIKTVKLTTLSLSVLVALKTHAKDDRLRVTRTRHNMLAEMCARTKKMVAPLQFHQLTVLHPISDQLQLCQFDRGQ